MSRTTFILIGIISFIFAMCLVLSFIQLYNGIFSIVVIILWLVAMAVFKRRYWVTPEIPVDIGDDNIRGINGWLVFPAIGVILIPLLSIASILKDSLPVFINGTLTRLSNPLHPNYSAMWAPFFTIQIAFQVLIALYCVFVAVIFFQRRRSTPIAMIVLYGLTVCFRCLLFFIAMSIPYFASHSSAQMGGQLFAIILTAVAWSLYFVYSKRVKATFTE